MSTKFDPSSWQKAAADWEAAAADIAAIAQDMQSIGVVASDGGSTTLLDDALAGIVPASAEAVAGIVAAIGRAMTSEALNFFSTGKLYEQVEDMNVDDADTLNELLAYTPWNG